MEASELFVAVAERLRSAEVPLEVIGAVAHWFPRETINFDFFVTERQVPDCSLWEGIEPQPAVRIGYADDPLVDVVVGRSPWQLAAIARSRGMSVGSHLLPGVRLTQLVLAKLHAGGFRDPADIQMMPSGPNADAAPSTRSSRAISAKALGLN